MSDEFISNQPRSDTVDTKKNAELPLTSSKIWNSRQLLLASILLDTTIDPIIRRLLLLGKLRQTNNNTENARSSSSVQYSQQHQIGVEIERLKQEKHLLIHLRGALENVVDTVNNNEHEHDGQASSIGGISNEQGKKAITVSKMMNQMNGVAVPLFGILQQQHQQNQSYQRSHVIIQSANYVCMEEAALSLKRLWRFQQRIDHSGGEPKDGGTTNNISGSTSTSNIHSLVLPSLVSCAMALSSLEISNDSTAAHESSGKEYVGNVDKRNNDEKKSSEGNNQDNTNNQALDRGEDCAMAILSCMQSFFCSPAEHDDQKVDEWFPSPPNNDLEDNHSALACEVGSAMGGALVARLVQGCLSLLPQQSLDSGPSTNCDTMAYQRENASLQLEALKTLQALLMGIPLLDLWRSILPGCFAGLYRTALSKLRYSSAASSYKVASASVQVLVLLLKQSLSVHNPPIEKPGAKGGNDSIQSITASLMAAVQLSEQQQASVEVPPLDERMQELKKEVNKRLVGPLTVLLSLLSANRSGSVRKSGLYLCQVILIDIQSVWTESNMKALGRKSLEYCLMMLGDEDSEISACSCKILRSYKSHLGAANWKRQLSKTVVPTILELVEALPAFAKSGRESEVINYLRLIDGYLVISFRGMENDFDMQECLTKKRKSGIGSAFSCTEALDTITKSFSVLFNPDIDSMTCSPMIETDSSSEMVLHQESSKYRFLYLKDEAVNAAKNTVHLVAKTLGMKRCAFMVDSCFAAIFESCSRSCNDNLLINEGINRRLHWSGLCVFSSELLNGICQVGNDRKHKNSMPNLHILTSLASSVLPVIVSEPLWTLPTVNDKSVCSNKQATQNDDLTARRIEDGSPIFNKQVTSSVSVLNSNAVLVSTLMAFMCQFSRALGDTTRLHLPTILFPILERASPIGNHSSVQSAAFALLQEISLSIGYKDITTLFALNFDYLVDTISLRLRTCSKVRTPVERSLVGVIDVILRSLVHHVRHIPGTKSEDAPLVIGHVAMVGHMLNCLLNHLDRQSQMSSLGIFDMVKAFQSMIVFMDSSIESYIDNHNDLTVKLPEDDTEDWFLRLDLELTSESPGYAEDDNSKDGMFDQLDSNEEDVPSVDTPPVDKNDATSDEKETDFVHEIPAINSILSRSCYILCYSDLQIQVLCCEAILSGFHSLGKIGSFRKKLRGESASNPLLPAIAEFWPSIMARLQSASEALGSVKKLSRSDLSLRHIMATDQETGPSRVGLEVLLSKLLCIVSELCLSSDGFFVDRFENDAYPIIARLMRDILPTDMDSLAFSGYAPSFDAKTSYSLLLPILTCFKSTYESSCRYGLARLIPSAGTMILPLLSCAGPIGDSAMAALKAMLAVDCDALWRGLHALSKRPFPPNPIGPELMTESVGPSKAGAALSTCCRAKGLDHILSQKAGELLVFIEDLPEQHL